MNVQCHLLQVVLSQFASFRYKISNIHWRLKTLHSALPGELLIPEKRNKLTAKAHSLPNLKEKKSSHTTFMQRSLVLSASLVVFASGIKSLLSGKHPCLLYFLSKEGWRHVKMLLALMKWNRRSLSEIMIHSMITPAASAELSGVCGFSQVTFPVLQETDFSSALQKLDFIH